MAILDFFQAIWSSFLRDLSLAEQILAAVPLALYFFGVFAFLKRRYIGANKHLAVELAEEKEASKKWIREYNKVNSELQTIQRNIPEYWSAIVNAERGQGNEARALGFLRDEFGQASRPLAEAAEELAKYHCSVGFDLGKSHLLEAQRYCRLAILHGESNANRKSLLDEIEFLLVKDGEIERESFRDWDDLQAAFPSNEDSLAAIRQLNSATQKQVEAGLYQIANLIVGRTLIIARRQNLTEDSSALATRYLKATVLQGLGYYRAALDEIEAYAPQEVKALGPDHPDVLATLHRKASVLHSLGQDRAALDEIEAFAPQLEKVLGPDHPNFLVARQLKASVLHGLGQHQAALEEIEAIAPLQIKALGPNHPDFLETRKGKADVLDSLDRHQAALDEIEAFAPLQLKALGPDHPNVLTTRLLIARQLDSLGQHQAALDEIEAYTPLLFKTLGPEHPDYLTMRHLKARVLNSLGQHHAALNEIQEFAPLLVKALGPNHTNVLTTRQLKARVLNSLGQHQAALDEIEAFAPLQVKALGPDHPKVIETVNLRKDILDELVLM